MSRGESPEDSDVLYTAERPGLCCAKPCLGCCACTDSCTDAMVLHQGHVHGDAGELVAPKPILMCRQERAFESPFHPAIEVMAADAGPVTKGGESVNGQVYLPATHKVEGPMCFGGCVELCCKSEWKIKSKAGDEQGLIEKQAPDDLKGFAREAMTDADHYKIVFGPSMEADAKAALITTTLLVDYMFFEQDLGVCRPKRGQEGGMACETTLWNCYCCGCVCPCNCTCGGDSGVSGGD